MGFQRGISGSQNEQSGESEEIWEYINKVLGAQIKGSFYSNVLLSGVLDKIYGTEEVDIWAVEPCIRKFRGYRGPALEKKLGPGPVMGKIGKTYYYFFPYT